jgi:hypothetical protein
LALGIPTGFAFKCNSPFKQLKEILSRIKHIVYDRIFVTEEEVTEIIKSVLQM